jgi:acetyltransferase-like isoleucine patch superfamily enzyme
MPDIHPTAEVQTQKIGKNTKVWQYCVILKEATIGEDCNINFNVFIENDVVVGNRVTIKPGVQLWDGVHIEDDVFIGPNVTFTNDAAPRSKQYSDEFLQTTVKKGVSIGANTTLLPGITIGAYAMIGAGSVVTKDVPPHELWYGNPAIHRGYVTKSGLMLDKEYKDKSGKKHSLDD